MARRPRRPAGPSTGGGYAPGQNPGGSGQAISVAPGAPYGERQQLTDMQRQMPLPQAAPVPTPPAGAPVPSPGGPPSVASGGGMQAAFMSALQAADASRSPEQGGGGGLLAPSARPAEPVTHGLPIGPGAGPEAVGGIGAPSSGPNDQILANLYRAYQIAPSEGLRALIERTEALRGPLG